MRPVNLIPADQQRSSKTPIRTGPIAYLLVGALAIGLGLVTMLVLTNNKIADHRTEIANLEAQQAAATQKAQQFASFTNFASLEQSRRQTVANLADSRFDWERVMRELSRVLPSNVWLTDLTGTAGGGTDAASGAPASGPTLTISGCAVTQDGVAGFLSALRDIDGVTRVGLSSSARPSGAAGGGTSAGGDSAGGGSDCATKDFIAQFDIQVAFDKAPAPQSATAAPTAPTTPTGTTPATTTPSTTPAPTSTTPTDTGTPASATTP